MDTYRYFTGQSQFGPYWLYRLPNFFMPIYQGDLTFKWLGITIPADSAFIGDTLFMHWRRQIKWALRAGGGNGA